MPKYHSNSCSCPDEYAGQVRRNGQWEALALSLDNSPKIEIRMALAVVLDCYGINHICSNA
ncbi:hypothetical protein IAE39_000639 [Pseudomonas sp. S37]|nr:hypothetical protein [Pseudomonas sp. S37]